MVRPTINLKNVKLTILFVTVFVAFVLVVAGLLNLWISHQIANHESSAILVGVTKAKQECLKEGLSAGTCQSINGSASDTECSGQTCWIVYASASDRFAYSASVTVQDENGRYKVIDYLRDTITR